MYSARLRLGTEFWADALLHATWLYNRTYHSKINVNVMKRHKLKQTPEWDAFLKSEWKQLDQYAKVGMFGDPVNSFQAIVPLTGQEKSSFFTGMYLPQKSVLSPPIESQYKPFQKHVSSC
jgi:hypothetical protein